MTRAVKCSPVGGAGRGNLHRGPFSAFHFSSSGSPRNVVVLVSEILDGNSWGTSSFAGCEDECVVCEAPVASTLS